MGRDIDVKAKVTKESVLDYIAKHKGELRQRFGVKAIGLFGSFARGDASDGSDIDVVVELERPDLFDLIGVKQTLEEAFGRKVEVIRLRETMNVSLKHRIQRDAVYV
jgi:hypothetical protein